VCGVYFLKAPKMYNFILKFILQVWMFKNNLASGGYDIFTSDTSAWYIAQRLWQIYQWLTTCDHQFTGHGARYNNVAYLEHCSEGHWIQWQQSKMCAVPVICMKT
jgi:hypothetical protein